MMSPSGETLAVHLCHLPFGSEGLVVFPLAPLPSPVLAAGAAATHARWLHRWATVPWATWLWAA
jgi:hypothetical protein